MSLQCYCRFYSELEGVNNIPVAVSSVGVVVSTVLTPVVSMTVVCGVVLVSTGIMVVVGAEKKCRS